MIYKRLIVLGLLLIVLSLVVSIENVFLFKKVNKIDRYIIVFLAYCYIFV